MKLPILQGRKIFMKTNTIAFICPISKPNTEIRKRADEIMNRVLNPIALEVGYSVIRADLLTGDIILEDIIKMIMNAEIVVADLTDFNPNVMYELGVRQAIKGKSICIIKDENLDNLPFDIVQLRTIPYKFDSISGVDDFRNQLKDRIKSSINSFYTPQVKLTKNDLVELFGATVVINSVCGKKDHYLLANQMINRKCKKIFLMQRSSSLVLGAEQSWDQEKEFINILMSAINSCDKFYHIISTEGIRAHIRRKASYFPEFKDFKKRLLKKDGNVLIKCDGANKDKEFLLKNLPNDDSDEFFKLDRQARIMSIEYEDNQVETVIVQNLGSDQTCFHIRGDLMKDYLNKCIDYYASCRPVKWREIERLYKEYIELDKEE